MTHCAIGIVTHYDDPHARIVRGLVQRNFGRSCEIVAVDRIPDSGALHWRLGSRGGTTLPTIHGGNVDVSALDVLWWRRASALMQMPAAVTDQAAVAQVSEDSLCALGSTLRSEFRGTWVSHPDATRRGELKLLQLKAALAAGLRVPGTIVSQDPDRIREFFDACGGAVVVKALTTRPGGATPAARITAAMLRDTAMLRLGPAIYQECIAGTRHLRVHVMGDRVLTALIEADNLDWRYDLAQATFTPYKLEDAVARALIDVLARLELRMGVFDLKLDPDGEPVWLEVNPQGQYLFVEALCGLPLSDAMAEFLVAEATGRVAHDGGAAQVPA